MTVNFKTFLEMTAPAFPEKASYFARQNGLLQAGALDRDCAWSGGLQGLRKTTFVAFPTQAA